MANATRDIITVRRSMQEPLYDDYDVKAGVNLPAGTVAGILNGNAKLPEAGDDFFVFVRNGADNTGGLDGDQRLIKAEFRSSYLFASSVDITKADIGKQVGFTDNQTFSTAAGGAQVGRITHLDDDGVVGAHISDGSRSAYVEIDGPLKYQA